MIGQHVDQFEILEEIGRGGMGVVYLARQDGLDRLVALKVLPFADRDMAERLRREAAVLAELQHPHIVPIFGIGEHLGSPYYVMAYCPGGSLADVGRTNGTLDDGQLCGLLAPVADALGAIHRRGMLHRDVKPSNVLLSADGQPFLSDFGLVLSGAASRMTASGNVLGTIGYSAPELLSGSAPTAAADVFSFGVLGYELAAGRQPFVGVHVSGVLDAVRRGDFVPLASLAPHIDGGLVRLIEACLAADPAARPGDLSDIANRIRGVAPVKRVVPVRRTETQMRTIAPARSDRVVSAGSGSVGTVAAPPRRRMGSAAMAALAVVAAAVGFGVVLVLNREAPRRAIEVDPGATVLASAQLPVKTVGGVTTATTWTVVQAAEGDVVTGATTITNTFSEPTLYTWDEIIPKQLAASAGDVVSTPSPSSVVKDDPILRYCLMLQPGAEGFVSWRARVATAGLDNAALADLARAWSTEFDSHVANPGGEPCTTGDAVDATTTTETTTVATVPPETSLPPGPVAGETTTSPPTRTTVPTQSGQTNTGGGTTTTKPTAITTTTTAATTTTTASTTTTTATTTTVTVPPTPPPTAPPTTANLPPTAQSSGPNGACRGQVKDGTLGPKTSDPNGLGDIARWEVTQISFGATTFQWTFNQTSGYWAFKFPAGTASGTQINFKWRAVDSAGNVSNVATWTFQAVSC